jgi:3-methyladenine DNA glycosylase AlkC
MPEALKDLISRESLQEFALCIQSVHSSFPVDQFVDSTMDETWAGLELKARWQQISRCLGKYLPSDYPTAIGIIDQVITKYDGFLFIVFPDFVEAFGQDEQYWDLSMVALERYTQYSSSELAVRPFIIKHETRMMTQMLAWSKHENEHVRRLASEGCRPQLPWAPALNSFKKDPSPVLPVLEQLKTDPSPYVRKSVANNINDISKTHSDLVAKLAEDWYGKNEHTNWIVKHGCRTLLKKGHREVLAIFGYHDTTAITVADFSLGITTVSIGGELTFSFSVLAKEPTKVRLEYGIDYVKANGKRNRKLFQISEFSLKEKEKKAYAKKHSFADLSTRKHYPGLHSIVLIVNGVEQGNLDFTLV